MAQLTSVTLGELAAKKQELLHVPVDARVSDVLMLLKEYHILSVPVWDSQLRQFIGIVDAFEIMRFTSLGFLKQRIYQDDFFQKSDFQQHTVGELVAKFTRCREQLHLVKASDTLADGLKILSAHHHHRLLVNIDPSATSAATPSPAAWRVLSQLDIIRYLLTHTDKLSGPQQALLKEKKVEELNLVNPLGSPIVQITTKDTALDGFWAMFEHKVNAVAVVDISLGGKLATNLSASDLRGITAETLDKIKLPVLDYLQEMTGKRPAHPITCTADCTLLEIMTSVSGASIHRVWVVDAAEKPIGVITLTDILNCLQVTSS